MTVKKPRLDRFVPDFGPKAYVTREIAPQGVFTDLVVLAQRLGRWSRDLRQRSGSPADKGRRRFSQEPEPGTRERWISCRGAALLLSVFFSLAFWAFVATLVLV